MLASLEELKTALGIALNDTSKDATLNQSLANANALIAGYIGADLSDIDKEHVYTVVLEGGAKYVKLPLFPVFNVVSVTAEGTPVDSGDYFSQDRVGIIDVPSGLPSSTSRYGCRVSVVYTAGFEEVPQDLNMVCLNMAAGIYNMGGTFASAASGGTGELKSLTMFDAMSMSFDVGGSSQGEAAGSPAALIKAWQFVLDKYRCNSPVLR